MTRKELKIFIGEIILLSDYSDCAKKQLLNLVVESDINKLKDTTIDIIDHVNENDLGIGHILSIAQRNPVSTYYLVTSLVDVAYKLYKNVLSQSARACVHEANKSECIKNYKIKALNAQIKKLVSDLSLCNKSTNPNRCEYLIAKKINKLKFKLRKLR
jgi:hypothetical protein